MASVETNVLALDFGGTKLAAAVVDPISGEIRAVQRHSTPARQGARASIQTMFELGRQALREAGLSVPTRVGISFGGPVASDRTTVLKSNHVADWEGMPLPQLARDAFGCPAYMDNDANAAALGAWAFDAHRQPDHMVYIQVSTGVGGGLIFNRALYRGGALAGEFGHITVEPGGPLCACGKHGCVESLCSGWALARDGRADLQQADPHSPLYRLSTGSPENVDARLLIQAAEEGDPLAKARIEHGFTALGIAIANVICLLDPELVVLGGGITRAESTMRAILEPVLAREVHPLFQTRYRLQFSRLDGKETLLGAALLED